MHQKPPPPETGGFELTLCLSRIDRYTAELRYNVFRFFVIFPGTYYLELSVEAAISLSFDYFSIMTEVLEIHLFFTFDFLK